MNRTKVLIVLAAAACAGAVFGAAGAATASTANHFPETSAGESYGSLASVSISDAPDLILAEGDDGKTTGYVLKTDLLLPGPSTPAEAVEREKTLEGDASERTIPLYDLKGVKIGTYTISKGVVTTDAP